MAEAIVKENEQKKTTELWVSDPEMPHKKGRLRLKEMWPWAVYGRYSAFERATKVRKQILAENKEIPENV